MADEPHDKLSSVIFTAFGPRGSATPCASAAVEKTP
jgi:hypothetical protein